MIGGAPLEGLQAWTHCQSSGCRLRRWWGAKPRLCLLRFLPKYDGDLSADPFTAMTDYLSAPRHASSSPGRQNPTCQLSLVHELIANLSSMPLNVTSCAGANLNARFHFAPGNSSSAATTFIFAPGCVSTSRPELSNATMRFQRGVPCGEDHWPGTEK